MPIKTLTPLFLQQRRFFLVLPILILPFITLLFWALDGGKTSAAPTQTSSKRKGLNVELPPAYLQEDNPLNKLSYYEKAAADSAKLEKFIQEDPYYKQNLNPVDTGTNLKASKPNALMQLQKTSTFNSYQSAPLLHSEKPLDSNEAQVYQKLELLNKALLKTEELPSAAYSGTATLPGATMNKEDIDRLEQMMMAIKNGEGNADPEMQQLNTMLEKILDIQHPERVREKLRNSAPPSNETVLSVALQTKEPISLLVNEKTSISRSSNLHSVPDKNGFYSLAEPDTNHLAKPNVIPAIIPETQTLGLIKEVTINNVQIPSGNLVYGIVSLNGERLNIQVNSIWYKNDLFPVELTAFDLDGISGLYVPGAITREVAKQSADQAMQGMNLSTLVPSIGAQAANASIEAAKTLFSKKIKLIKVTVKAGHQVLLQDQKQKTTS